MILRRVAAGLTLAVAGLGLVGCSRELSAPDLGAIYNRAAQADDSQRNPIIVIPGVLGSRLRQGADGPIVWGAFGPGSVDVRSDEGLRALALPMAQGVALHELRDDLVADVVLDSIRVNLLRLPIESRAYFKLLGALGAGGYRDETLAGVIRYGDRHFTCFQFPYDWRRDLGENAVLLDRFIAEKKAYVEAEMARRYGRTESVQFDLVAHSMGGLLARYYLRYGATEPDPNAPVPWSGAAQVERAILIAPPNAGSLESLGKLVLGADYSWVLPHFEAAMLGTLPAIYSLLPRERHGALIADERNLDPLDPAVWAEQGWGLLDPQQADVLARLLPEVAEAEQRQAIALDHLHKVTARARQVQAALDRPARPPPGLSLHLIAGDAEPTISRMRVLPGGELAIAGFAAGDGIVLRSSSLMDERTDRDWQPRLVSPVAWQQVTFLYGDHLRLLDQPAFTDNLLYALLEHPRPPAAASPAAPQPSSGDAP